MSFKFQVDEFLTLVREGRSDFDLAEKALEIDESTRSLSNSRDFSAENLLCVKALIAFLHSTARNELTNLTTIEVYVLMIVMVFIERARNKINLHELYNASINHALCREILCDLLERNVSCHEINTTSGMSFLLTKQEMRQTIRNEIEAAQLCSMYESYSDERMLDVTVDEIRTQVQGTAYLPSEKQTLCEKYLNKLQQSISRLSHDRASFCTFWIVLFTAGITFLWCDQIYAYLRDLFERELRAHSHLPPLPPSVKTKEVKVLPQTLQVGPGAVLPFAPVRVSYYPEEYKSSPRSPAHGKREGYTPRMFAQGFSIRSCGNNEEPEVFGVSTKLAV